MKMSLLGNIFWNIMGGIIAGLAVLGLQYLYKIFRARSFKQFFGTDDEYNIIYCLYDAPKCPQPDKNCKLVFGKPLRKGSGVKASGGINLQQITSVAEAKGVGYLVEAFSKNVRIAPNIKSDVDETITSRTNISFLSIGGRTNYKTCDLLEDKENIFLDFRNSEIISKNTNTALVHLSEATLKHDYGFIVKMHPESNPERTWLCCCGFGIIGTIGAAYYLSKKWKKIKKYVGNKQFGCILYCAEDEEQTKPTHILVKKRNLLLNKWVLYKAKREGLKVVLL